MDPSPAIRVTVAGQDGPDEDIDNPSDEVLAELLHDVADGLLLFFILTRTNDQSEQTYIQVALADSSGGSGVNRQAGPGELTIEHRQGSADRHFIAASSDQRLLHEVLVGWRSGSGTWETALPWTRILVEDPPTPAKPKRRWFGRR